jgi:glyoxylate/hydroxypyruvate reductase A
MSLLIAFNNRPDRLLLALRKAAPSLAVAVWPDDTQAAQACRYVLAWKPPSGVIAKLPKLEVIFSYGAGVDHLTSDPSLPSNLPIVRLVEGELTRRMTEYVVLHTLLHHRRMTEYQALQREARWHEYWEPVTHNVRVGIMGLGVLGQDAASKLAGLGYQVAGWSRSRKRIDGIATFAGAAGLDSFLARTEILVVLLPLTAETTGIVDAKLLSKLARNPELPGPVLINAGRGGLQVGADILSALDNGTLYAASLDVFEEEPLPTQSPFWHHPRVIVTPHNASNSAPEGVARYVREQIARHERGEPLENVVDRAKGY